MSHWINDSLTHWFNDWFSDSLVHWFNSMIHWTTEPFIPVFKDRFTDSLVHWFIDSLIHCITDSLIHWFIDSLICRLMDSLVHWFIDSMIHWFTGSLVHWFVVFFSQLCLDSFMWGFPRMGVPQSGWFVMDSPIKMDDFGAPIFLGNLHVISVASPQLQHFVRCFCISKTFL